MRRPEGKIFLGRHRRRWEDNIIMDLKEVGCDARTWMDLAQDRDPMVGLCKSVNEPPGSIKAK